MRLKTSRRLILLASVLVVVGLAAFAAVYVRGWQRARLTQAFFEKGQSAFKARDDYSAQGNTGHYLTRVKSSAERAGDDRFPDAARVYAESRRLIEESDGHPLREAIPWYRQYLDRRPDDRDAALTLLQTYNKVGL